MSFCRALYYEGCLLIKIRVELRPTYFTNPDHYELVRRIMDTEIVFENKKNGYKYGSFVGDKHS